MINPKYIVVNLVYKELFNQFISTLNSIKKHPLLLLFSSLIDFSLLFVFSIISYFGFEALMPRLNQLSNLISENPKLLSAGIGTGSLGMPMIPFQEFQTLFKEMIWVFVIYLAVLLVVFAVILGLNWSLSFRMIKKSKSAIFKRFIKIFSTYFVVYAIISVVSLILSINSLFKSEGIINFILIFVGVIVLFLFMINVSLINKYNYIASIKKTFEIIKNKFLTSVLAFIIIVVMFFAVDLISRLLGFLQNYQLGYYLWLAITGILLLPTITLARLFMIKVINKIEKN